MLVMAAGRVDVWWRLETSEAAGSRTKLWVVCMCVCVCEMGAECFGAN